MAKETIFKKLIKEARDANVRGRAATEWLRARAMSVKSVNVPQLTWALHEQAQSRTVIGSMYLFRYDPKWKKELPYYDIYPLIFPIGIEKGRMLGINFHYLPYPMRAELMDALYTLETNNRSRNLRLQLSYQILKSFSRFPLVKPTIHSYLSNHVQSPFIKIPSSEWDIALFLPMARFQKASQARVWADSIRKAQ